MHGVIDEPTMPKKIEPSKFVMNLDDIIKDDDIDDRS